MAATTPPLRGHRCPFCDYIEGRPTERGTLPCPVWDGDVFLAFMDPLPIQPGHVLVVPRRHATSIFDLTTSDAEALGRAVHACSSALRAALMPDGLNVFQNNGIAAGQSEQHLHVHLVPRHEGDGGTFPAERLRADHADLLAIARRIRDCWPPA